MSLGAARRKMTPEEELAALKARVASFLSLLERQLLQAHEKDYYAQSTVERAVAEAVSATWRRADDHFVIWGTRGDRKFGGDGRVTEEATPIPRQD